MTEMTGDFNNAPPVMLQNGLYLCDVWHQRLAPKRYAFRHRVSFFCLNLSVSSGSGWLLPPWLLGQNRFALYAFHERDHLGAGAGQLIEALHDAARANGYTPAPDETIFFIGQLTHLGYVFNPVCFFVFCGASPQRPEPLFVLAEVENTFYERKLYPVPPAEADAEADNPTLQARQFKARHPKLFYVSPYADLDDDFVFNLSFLPQGLDIRIDTESRQGEPQLLSRMHGPLKPLTTRALLRHTFALPAMAWQIIALIHFHALRLYMLGLRVRQKTALPQLQQGRIVPYSPKPTFKPTLGATPDEDKIRHSWPDNAIP
ncbi:MAG: DUF1365 domain-containing protein [Vampirovibrionales bacterium]|nr:DUF1365 domain-containing protein [Vampirovibrionales bacterium]